MSGDTSQAGGTAPGAPSATAGLAEAKITPERLMNELQQLALGMGRVGTNLVRAAELQQRTAERRDKEPPQFLVRGMAQRAYSSRAESGSIRTWLADLESCLGAYGMSVRDALPGSAEDKRLRGSLLCLLTGQAREACSRWEQQHRDDLSHTFHTYTGLKQLLELQFGAVEERTQARAQLAQLRQGAMTIRAYADLYMKLVGESGYGTSAGEQQVLTAQFSLGLGPVGQQAYQQRYVYTNQHFKRDPTLAEAIEAACLADATSVPVPTPPPPARAGPTPMELGALDGGTAVGVVSAVEALVARVAALEVSAGRQRGGTPDPRNSSSWPRGVRRTDADIERCRREKRCFLCDSTTHSWMACPQRAGSAGVDAQRYERSGWAGRDGLSRNRSPDRRSRSPNGRTPR
jgi:hypothetical protein